LFNCSKKCVIMRSVFLVLLFLQIVVLSTQITCPATGRVCISTSEYQLCVTVNGVGALTGSILTCPAGQVCDEATIWACNPGSNIATTPISAATRTIAPTVTTTTVESVTPPTCNGTADFPGPSCNQYYHCLEVMWWWDYEILTCPSGQAFDEITSTCANSTTCA
jgi:hypothetical protein